MYESPFDMVMTPLGIAIEEVRDSINGQIIESVLKATRSVNVTVDKEELLRALRYDRDQYKKGYDDAMAEIVHCKDCKHWMPYDWMFSEVWQSKNIADYPEDEIGCNYCDMAMKANDFCSRGERKIDG